MTETETPIKQWRWKDRPIEELDAASLMQAREHADYLARFQEREAMNGPLTDIGTQILKQAPDFIEAIDNVRRGRRTHW